MSFLELFAAGLGLVNVWLVVRRNVWNYPFGLVMVALYAVVFYRAHLYSDTILQGYYFVVQLYGWWVWVNGRDASGHVRPELMSGRARLSAAVVTLSCAAAMGWYFATFTNAAAPWLDAFIAAASVVGQYLQSVRKIECWLWWIIVDEVAIGLYFWKGLYPTSLLYGIFLIMSVVGLMSWRRQFRYQGQGI